MTGDAVFREWGRRSVLVSIVVGISGCNTTLDSPPTPTPSRPPSPTATPTGPLNLTFTVRECDGTEIRIHRNSSSEPLFTGVDSLSVTLDRGETYYITAETEDREYELGEFKAVGTGGEKELVLEGCSYGY